MSINNLVSIREFQYNDIPFVLDSSISCLSKYTESLFKGWEYPDIKTYLETIILHSLNTQNYSIFIAINKDRDADILAYIIADTAQNHIFLQYTKYFYRGLGIQKALLLPLVIDNTKQITVSWQTKQMLKYKKNKNIRILNNYPMNTVNIINNVINRG